ncbi:energy transducer TonB [Flagellimonas aquimarina]|uniref:Energy transducer TonB n=1 Tax=Flagellimonas aquimarina TaxID=2201895 RepID=A0A316KZ29_9FLAO|nr:energy transducer TonB [Allomuricauda koreensis]PWL37959.1 energy transducer TonB [Allomuricauda koreensis]
MELKKNQELELKKNSVLYFSIGMTAVLLLAYIALEWKTFYETPEFAQNSEKLNDIDEVLPPITIKLPPPPKTQTPPVIEIVDDEEKIIETIIESTETDQVKEIADIEDIEVAKDDVPDEVSFIVIEDVPVFPGCENESDKRACFQEMMQKHIRKNFRYPEPAQDMGLQGRVNLVFTIQKDGSIGNVRMRGPHKILETEAARIISKLPKMTPGKQRGTPVKVPFAIPITFKLQ